MCAEKVLFCHTPSEFPVNSHLVSYTSLPTEKFINTMKLVRPDVSLTQGSLNAASNAYLLITDANWHGLVAKARSEGITSPVIICLDMGSSYFDWYSFPIELLERGTDNQLCINKRGFTAYVAGFGDFFGAYEEESFIHSMIRYQQASHANSGDVSDQIEKVLANLADDASKTDYLKVLHAEPDELWEHWINQIFSGIEYFDYVDIMPGDVILNCGVHGGGEIPNFLAQAGERGIVVNIDPLGHHYLSQAILDIIGNYKGKVIECPIALNDRSGTVDLPVEEGGMAGSYHMDQDVRNSATTYTSFPCDTIDNIVSQNALSKVDYIKMDIEGAEPFALRGAEKTIKQHRPTLAISIYHTPEHFWEIPLYLMDLLNDYSFYVRNYHYISNETLLYAIPNERAIRPRNLNIPILFKK